MVEREAMREREAEAPVKDLYQARFDRLNQGKEIANSRVFIKGKQIPFVQGQQSIARRYTHALITDTVFHTLPSTLMDLFVHEIRTHSGRHTHQGGLALFVLQGQGYTTVDGVRYDWKAGDLVILPTKLGGVMHQHFNTNPDGPSRWIALIPQPFTELLGPKLIQNENHPDWKGQAIVR